MIRVKISRLQIAELEGQGIRYPDLEKISHKDINYDAHKMSSYHRASSRIQEYTNPSPP